MIRGFNSLRIREEFASIQGICTERKRAPSQFSSFRRFRLLRPAAHSLEFPLRSLSYLKRGIERCHLGATARYCRRVLEFRWHPIS